MERRTLVLADLHLTRHTPPKVTDDLVRLVELHPGARLVFAGDLLDLSAGEPRAVRDRAVEEAIQAHPTVRAAFARHVDLGGEIWIIGGNHDAEVGLDGFEDALVKTLGIASSAGARSRVRMTPWFFREGTVHIEHGHLYDPDNAPAHPLVVGKPSLGVHMVEEFIVPTGAHAYLNANDGKPLDLFLSAFRWYGVRAPYVVYRFLHAAFSALTQSGRLHRPAGEWALGQEELPQFATRAGVDPSSAMAVLAARATPTLASSRRTFARLYLDRVAATVAIGGGIGGLVAGQGIAFGAALSVGAMAMAASWARGHDRYGGTVHERLANGASRIAEATDAKLVIFGHTHREALSGAYANTGSFAFPRAAPGRPLLEVEGSYDAPRAVRRYLSKGELITG